MVDFNSKELFTANKGEILNLVILGRRDELINTFQLWREKSISRDANFKKYEYQLRACMFALFLEIKETLKRNVKEDVYESVKAFVYSNDNSHSNIGDEMINCFSVINCFLDEIKLIKIDTRKFVNTLRVEAENSAKGL